MRRYSLEDIGSGSHVHISLWENGENVFMGSGGSSRHGISKVGQEFMAGVLDHLPSLLAFTAPIPNRLPFFSCCKKLVLVMKLTEIFTYVF